MTKIALRLSALLLLASTLAAPAMLGANREWSVALVTMGLAFSAVILALGRPDLFMLRKGRPLWRLRWLVLGAATVFAIAAFPLFLTPSDISGAAELTRSAVIMLPPDRTMVFQALLGYAATCLALLLAYLIGIAEPEGRRPILYIFLTCSAGYAMYGIVSDCLGGVSACDAVAAPFVNRNSAATYFGFGLVTSLLYLTQYLQIFRTFGAGPPSRMSRRIANITSALFSTPGALAGVFLVTGAALLLTQSRGGAISIAIAIAFAGLVMWKRGATGQTHWRLAIPSVVVLVAILWATAGGNLLHRFETTEISSDARLTLYERSIAMIADRPLTGHGLGTFQERLPLYRTREMGPYPDFDKAHNTYLDLAAGIGIPAAMLVFVMIAWIFGALLEAYLRSRSRSIAPLIGAAIIVQVAVHSMVDFSMQIPGVQVNFALVVGLCLAATQPRGRTSGRRRGRVNTSEKVSLQH